MSEQTTVKLLVKRRYTGQNLKNRPLTIGWQCNFVTTVKLLVKQTTVKLLSLNNGNWPEPQKSALNNVS